MTVGQQGASFLREVTDFSSLALLIQDFIDSQLVPWKSHLGKRDM